ncbi:MAG: alanine--tRNA ligase, partial [Bacteroidota bacterium]
MKSAEIRSSFLRFFEERGHRIVPSAPVIPHGDPTLLFTNAGMNQFKDVFLGTGTRDYVRAADTQKCIRVSGKHNDLEEVGRDTYHHTFFEMLGNWSFGDYYKKEAISWAWELLTGIWGLEKSILYATVYETDDEAARIWSSETDIERSHIQRFGKKDNFWEMGDTGPCGPCSEIHIDLTPDGSGAALVNKGDHRVMEIWNLVFIQNNRTKEGILDPLPARHVDTGMGFERVSAVLQGRSSNYDSDVFTPIIESIANATSRPYVAEADQVAMRVIADHIRMLSFAIADGAIPGNDGRGYVLRRILRRAARFGRNLGMHEPFIYKITRAVVDSMGGVFPELKEKQSHIQRVVKGEEESFNATLDRGLEIFSSVLERIEGSSMFPGQEAFKLYDTYGFPLDLTQMMAQERGFSVDVGAFDVLMGEQRQRARESGKMEAADVASVVTKLNSIEDSLFVGYTRTETHARVQAVIDGKFLSLDRTPFYVESGGQVDDIGVIEGNGVVAEVLDSFKVDRKIVHEVKIVKGDPSALPGAEVEAIVDRERRMNIQRNHSATHLVHEALRRVLGDHLHQHGSLVAPDRLRFDFNHFEKITRDQVREIEDIVNEKIAQNISVNALNDPASWLSIEEAKRRYPNVKMFFGDKYGDRVRIVEIDPKFSVELCGGTHVANTSDLQLFKIISESSIASGIRRIEAVTGDGLRSYIVDQVRQLGDLDDHLETLLKEKEALEKKLGIAASGQPRREPLRLDISRLTPEDLRALDGEIEDKQIAIETSSRSIHDLEKTDTRNRVAGASSAIGDAIAHAPAYDGMRIVSVPIAASSLEELKSLGDSLRSMIGSGVGVLGTILDGKVALICVVTDDVIKTRGLQAGKIVGVLAKLVGGGGGGKPHMATAGGRDVEKLADVLDQAAAI